MRAQRVERVAAAIVVGCLAWLVAPGRIQPDTKLDLTVSPWRYVARSLDAWNGHAGLGELQNQAYGYLWPMGPFFGVAHSLGVPAWATQRLWWTLLLVVAYVGAERLLRRLGCSPRAALVAALAYALAPRVLTVLAEISVEAWPGALAPWLVLVAAGAVEGDRRALLALAGRTGVLAACLGGVNATASLVALAPAALYLLVVPTRRRPALVGAWAVGAALGAAWWLAPLLVLGRHAYPFLDHIETAATTTAVASVTNVLRGASHWVAYILTPDDHPTWQGGWVLAQGVAGILATTAVAAVGVFGLARRDPAPRSPSGAHAEPSRVRAWAATLLVLAVVAEAAGRGGSAHGLLAPQVREALDGPLAAFRNVHKADPLVRLPVALGLGWVLTSAARATAARALRSGAVLALAVTLLPLWNGRAADAWGYPALPPRWVAVAQEVDAMAARDGGSTMVLPSARFADQTWGRTNDEPLSALASSPVIARGSAPLGPPAGTRWLDAIDATAASASAQPHLAEALARTGVRRVVVRHDLTARAQARPAADVETTLARSPGFVRVGGGAGVTVWRVTAAAEAGAVAPVTVAAAPETWFALRGADAIASGVPVILAEDPGAADDAAVVTDGLRWRTHVVSKPPAEAASPTLAASDPRPTRVGTKDLAPGGDPARAVVRRWTGPAVGGVDATSTAADPSSRHPGPAAAGVAAAVDGDPGTSWFPGGDEPRPAITLRWSTERELDRVVVTVPREVPSRPAAVEVDAGGRTVRARVPTDATTVVLRLGGVRTDRLTVAPVAVGPWQVPGIVQVDVEGSPVGSALVLPAAVAPDARLLLTRDLRSVLPTSGSGEDPADLVRVVDAPAGRVAPVRVTGRPRATAAAADLLDAPLRVRTSRPDALVDHRPGAALDGDPRTRARVRTSGPVVLELDLGRPRTVSGVRVGEGQDRGFTGVRVETASRARSTGPEGGRFAPLRARRVTITLSRPPGTTAAPATLPELSLLGAPHAGSARLTLGCGDAGEVRASAGSARSVVELGGSVVGSGASRRVLVRPCGSGTLRLSAGGSTVVARASATVEPVTVLLGAPAGATAGAVRRVTREDDGRDPEHARHTVEPGPGAVLATTHAAESGWRATDADGRVLERVTVDGWRQGYVLPPSGSATTVLEEYRPGRSHRLGLLGGAGAAVLAALLAALGLRRRPMVPPPSAAAIPADPGAAGAGRRTTLAFAGVGVAVVVAVLVAGWTGVLAAVVSGLVPPRRRAAAAGLALALAGAATAVLGLADQRSLGAWVGQLLGTAAVVVLVLAVTDAPRPGRRDASPGSRAPRRSAS